MSLTLSQECSKNIGCIKVIIDGFKAQVGSFQSDCSIRDIIISNMSNHKSISSEFVY